MSRSSASTTGTEEARGDARRRPAHPRPRGTLLGPAFIAAIAYVDPGNVAANLTAGAQFGYLLLWVLVAANAMAVLVQYLSAKLGIVTGLSLPEVMGRRLPRCRRLAYWGQAEIVAAATDVAEVIGGALALQLLFGVPLVLGGLITGVVSLGILMLTRYRGGHVFQTIIIGLLAVLTLGFCAGLLFSPPSIGGMLGGIVPRFEGAQSVLLAASMLGATVMPHAVYLHSALVRDHHGSVAEGADRRRVLRATRWDVVLALLVAGGVNISMLVLAASTLPGRSGTDSIPGAHAAITDALGPLVGVLFGVGLLASGLASTSVGSMAGAEIMKGLLHVRIPLFVRRVVTLVPALVLLATGVSPTWLLVLSQVVLSFGIAFALVPLVRATSDPDLMGCSRNALGIRIAAWASVAVVVALNLALIWLTVSGA